MLKQLQKNLYFIKMNLLFNKGTEERKIVPFDDEFYKKMSTTYYNGLPISIRIKYFNPTSLLGECYNRSLFMFFCFDDSLLVRADVKDLEYNHGKEYARHGWIEIGNYVYDPSLLARFDKDLYYKIYCPTNITKINIEQFKKTGQELYNMVKNTTIEDYQIGGSKRKMLLNSIPFVKGLAKMYKNENLNKELEEYLALVQYDEEQIYGELNVKFDSSKLNVS